MLSGAEEILAGDFIAGPGQSVSSLGKNNWVFYIKLFFGFFLALGQCIQSILVQCLAPGKHFMLTTIFSCGQCFSVPLHSLGDTTPVGETERKVMWLHLRSSYLNFSLSNEQCLTLLCMENTSMLESG